MNHIRLLATALLMVPALGLAQPYAPEATDLDFDPWERMNRKVYAFNANADRYVIRPVARGYARVTSPEIRTVISNFFGNLRLPLSAVHALLQGKPRVAGRNLSRFSVNSTVGLLGLFDPASKFGIDGQQEDLGQTLATWGVPQGPYLVLPFIGPSSIRDFMGGAADGYVDPTYYYARKNNNYLPPALELVNLRTSLFATDPYIQEAYDPYAFVRDAYRQRRIYAIYDGEPPAELLDQLLMPEDDPADLLEDD